MPGPDLNASAIKFMREYLGLDEDFIGTIHPFSVQRFHTSRSKVDTEVVIAFNSANTRDFVKPLAHSLSLIHI